MLLCQVAQHQMAAVQSLSKLMGWTVGSSEPCLGVGATEPLGSAAAVVLTAPTGEFNTIAMFEYLYCYLRSLSTIFSCLKFCYLVTSFPISY